MKTQVYKTSGGAWSWVQRSEDDKVVFMPGKTYGTEAAATRGLLRHLDAKRKTSPHSLTEQHRYYHLCDGRTLLTLCFTRDGKWTWAILNPVVWATLEGEVWEWGEIDPEAPIPNPSHISPDSFNSEAEARADLVQTIKHGGCDDCVAKAYRDKRELRSGRPGERMEIKVDPVKVDSGGNAAQIRQVFKGDE